MNIVYDLQLYASSLSSQIGHVVFVAEPWTDVCTSQFTRTLFSIDGKEKETRKIATIQQYNQSIH
jgi:hypothetical protein